MNRPDEPLSAEEEAHNDNGEAEQDASQPYDESTNPSSGWRAPVLRRYKVERRQVTWIAAKDHDDANQQAKELTGEDWAAYTDATNKMTYHLTSENPITQEDADKDDLITPRKES